MSTLFHRRLCMPAIVACLAILPSAAGANDALVEAQKLYAAAFYERALTALEQIDPQQAIAPGDLRSIRRYKALCFIALDRDDDAARVVNEMVAAEPMASGDPADPPRLRDLVRRTRLQVVPGIARDLYVRGRTRYLQKAFAGASADFEAVMALVDDKALNLAAQAEFADLRLLAQGFLELSKNAGAAALTAPPAHAETAPAAQEKPGAPGEVTPPVTISQALPQVPYALRHVLRQPRESAIDVTVSPEGTVVSATVVAPSHPIYDALLVEAAKTWKYRPALRGGVPVPYTKRIRAVFPE